ncbi:hypothetical protein [Kitasatospora sp. NPDC002965]|uniref:hypothetical protein n=1 Tax=Kitasatospora sp. NPDC002965 TaxID=3154775 RepID=UPI0033A62F8B
MRTDLVSHLDPAVSLAPAARTASANGTGVDLANYDAAAVLINAGTWTDGSHTFEIQESDASGSGYTAVPDAYLSGAEPVVSSAPTASQIYKIGYLGIKRYLRIITTVTGTTTGAVYSATVVRGKPRVKP